MTAVDGTAPKTPPVRLLLHYCSLVAAWVAIDNDMIKRI